MTPKRRRGCLHSLQWPISLKYLTL